MTINLPQKEKSATVRACDFRISRGMMRHGRNHPMVHRPKRELIQSLVERGGTLSQIVAELLPELKKLVPRERFAEIRGALSDWDCLMCEIDESLLDNQDSERKTRRRRVA
jgi:hypothetical protein